MKAQQIRVVFQHFREGGAVVYYSTTLERKASGGVRQISIRQSPWSASWITKLAMFSVTASLRQAVFQFVALAINQLKII